MSWDYSARAGLTAPVSASAPPDFLTLPRPEKRGSDVH